MNKDKTDLNKTEFPAPNAKSSGAEDGHPFRDWKQAFGVTKEQLLDAVTAVGGSADKVREYLKTRR